MQALSDDQHIAAIEAKVDKLDKKIDDGFAEMRAEFKNVRAEMRAEFKNVRAEMRAEFRNVRTETRSEVMAARSEARADFRLLIGILLPMYLTIILGFAALLLQQHL